MNKWQELLLRCNPTYQLSNKENGFCHEWKAFPNLQLLCKYTHNHFEGTHNTVRSNRKWQRVTTFLLQIWPLKLADVSFSLWYKCSCMLTLRSLFAAHPHSTVAGPPECWPSPAPSEEGRGRRPGSDYHYDLRNLIVKAKLTVFGMIVISFTSAADLAKAAATMARLLVVCSCSLMAAPPTAPVKFAKTSS